jgi:hypothetical protein
MSSSLAGQDQRQRVALLLGIALASILLWQTALGSLLLYPFTILATWFHEMGHGIAAMLTGRGFERLLIFADGSGFAQSLGPADGYRLTDALIAASGPLGPAIAGALLIVSSRSPTATRNALAVLGVALVVSTLIWVRSLTGWLVLPALGIAIVALALRGSLPWRRFVIQLIGVQAASARGNSSTICSARVEMSAASCSDRTPAPSRMSCFCLIGSGARPSARRSWPCYGGASGSRSDAEAGVGTVCPFIPTQSHRSRPCQARSWHVAGTAILAGTGYPHGGRSALRRRR